MVPELDDLERLRREVAYYKQQLDALAGENIKLDYAISGLQHELKQKRLGFALLSELQQSVGVHKHVSAIFEITVQAVNATLGMDRTVILTPGAENGVFHPGHWAGFLESVTDRMRSIGIPLADQNVPCLLVNRATVRTPLTELISSSFDLPFFVAVPVEVERSPIGWIVSGRTNEMQPLYPPLDEGDADTFRAIAGLISASVRNMRLAVLEEMDRLKTEFFANISHEFRTPITLTLGPLEQMLAGREGALPIELRPQISMAVRNQQRLLALVNQILDLAKLEAGRMSLRAACMAEPNRFFEEHLSPFQTMAAAAGIELRLKRDEAASSVELWVDHEKLEKIFTNLLSNALKFTTNGHVEVSTSVERNRFVLRVEDTGIGIKKEELPYVFDRFRQADGTSSREYAGTGIGLALVQEMTRLHGGEVTVASEYGVGTTFTVRLPLGKEHLSADQIAKDAGHFERSQSFPAAMVGGQPLDSGELERLNLATEAAIHPNHATVLYVEDNPDLRRFVRGLLAPHYNVFLAADGMDGLEKARKISPDLILSDFMMPRMDGRGLLREIRADARFKSTPVIFLTARAGTEARVETLDAGADDYLSKPFDEGELLARIRNLLRAREQERALSDLARRLECRVQEQMAELVRTGELRRFLPASLAEGILSGKLNSGEESRERRKVTVVFVEIDSFNELCESLEPEDLSVLVNDYLREMTAIAIEHGGMVDAFHSGGMMVLFGTPEAMPVEQQARAAVETARAMAESMRKLSSLWRRRGLSREMALRIGINTGYCTVGIFGSDLQRSFTAVGGPVGVAAGLSAIARPGAVLCGAITFSSLREQADARPVASLVLPGGNGRPVEAYEILQQSAEQSPPPGRIAPSLGIGPRIPHYEILERLGAGGMGEVFLARDVRLGRPVAVKLLSREAASDPDRAGRFLREARAASALNHPNICIVYEAAELDDGRPYIAMEYIEGKTLEEYIGGKPVPLPVLVRIGVQMAEALGEAHLKGIIHRDVKSANIMITSRNLVKVLDFGLAKLADQLAPSGPGSMLTIQTESGMLIGTATYMSPEQARGEHVDHRTDIYSLGVVLYQMATGQLPFQGHNVLEVLNRVLSAAPAPITRRLPDFPPLMEGVIMKCLEKRAESRPPSMKDLLGALVDASGLPL